VLRPRVWAVVLWFALVGLFFAAAIKPSYDEGYIDPRLPLLVVTALTYAVFMLRARVVVADRAFWRRRFRSDSAVSLDALARVEYRRARWLQREGVGRIVKLEDWYGRRGGLKPQWWNHGGDFIAILAECVHHQGVDVDAKTAAKLDGARRDGDRPVPAWAYRSTGRLTGQGSPLASPPPPVVGWAPPMKRPSPSFNPMAIAAMLAVLALAGVGSVVAARTGSSALRSVRCNNARHLWAGNVGGSAASNAVVPPAAEVIVNLRDALFDGGTGTQYTLRPIDIADTGNTAAVRRDAQRLVNGYDLQWVQDHDIVADVQIEQFSAPTDALMFHRDYSEDHCRYDNAFAPAGIAGGVGFRCGCTGATRTDRVAFVRGGLRVQAIAWGVPRTSNHDAATNLARAALAAVEQRAPSTAVA
jgi:hypothetical protein